MQMSDDGLFNTFFVFFLCAEYTGPMCAKYQNIFLQPVVEYTKDTSPEVRQAAIYGCGVIAQVKF